MPHTSENILETRKLSMFDDNGEKAAYYVRLAVSKRPKGEF
jgi:hypothetical protein